jgi:hypothetical protein
LYLVRRLKPADHGFDINHVWPDRLISYQRVFLSSDGRIEVVKISLKSSEPEKTESAHLSETEINRLCAVPEQHLARTAATKLNHPPISEASRRRR